MTPVLRVAFVTGSTPDKWARRWAEGRRGTLDLVPVTEDEQRALLDSGAVDMLVARMPVGDTTDLHVVRLYEEQPVVVVGREHAAAEFDRIDLADLDQEQFPLGVPDGLDAVEQLAWPPMSPKDAVEVAASGTGAVVVPESVARLFRRKDTVAVPLDGMEPTQVALVWQRDRDDDTTQEFVGVVRGRSARSSRSR